MLVIGPIAPLGLFQDIEAALMGVVSFYKQHLGIANWKDIILLLMRHIYSIRKPTK